MAGKALREEGRGGVWQKEEEEKNWSKTGI